MSFLTALRLSFKYIPIKKAELSLTLLAFAASIGIIGIAIVLSLSYGFQKQIDNTQSGNIGPFPRLRSPKSNDGTRPFCNQYSY